MISNEIINLFMKQVHVLPREILGKSTFELGVSMMKWLSIDVVDKILLVAARLLLGNIEKYGLKRPSIGPLQLKNTEGKTPVLDIGALQKIKTGDIKIVPAIKKFSQGKVEFVNGEIQEIDCIILATGYCSNVPSWLKVRKKNIFFIFILVVYLFFNLWIVVTVMEVGFFLCRFSVPISCSIVMYDQVDDTRILLYYGN